MLWPIWMAEVLQLRPAFLRLRTFQWFVIALAAMTVRMDSMGGVTSFIRSLDINPALYTQMLHFYQSSAIDLPKLVCSWYSLSLKLFAQNLILINGRLLFAGDGIKIGKEGKHMPAVKLLHQSSDSNSKAEWIRGHSLQAICLLVCFADTAMAIPLTCLIHEGIRSGPRDKKTLIDKFLDLILSLEIKFEKGIYLVADAYYCCGSLARKMKAEGIYLITRVRKNAVAYWPPGPYSGFGRPAKYGEKVKLWDLFSQLTETMVVSAYGEVQTIKYGVFDLMWKSYGGMARYCLVDDPKRGKIIFLSPDMSLTAEDIHRAYTYRFKIEYVFKELIHYIGAFLYRFWTKEVKMKSGSGDLYIHRKTPEEKNKIYSKIFSYHLYIQMGLIAQGLLQYLVIQYSDSIWNNFRGWLRTIRPGIPASTHVAQNAMRNGLKYFRKTLPGDPKWQKFAKSLWDIPPPNEKRPSKVA